MSADNRSIEEAAQSGGEAQGTTGKFQITAEPWEGDHNKYLQQTPLRGPFKISPNIIQRDLERQVPMLGLSDIDVTRAPPPHDILRRWADKIAQRKTLKQMQEAYKAGTKTEENE
jgi:hypothetical protein